jgi:hypothetical protein
VASFVVCTQILGSLGGGGARVSGAIVNLSGRRCGPYRRPAGTDRGRDLKPVPSECRARWRGADGTLGMVLRRRHLTAGPQASGGGPQEK